jgi:hypothetical protein
MSVALVRQDEILSAAIEAQGLAGCSGPRAPRDACVTAGVYAEAAAENHVNRHPLPAATAAMERAGGDRVPAHRWTAVSR